MNGSRRTERAPIEEPRLPLPRAAEDVSGIAVGPDLNGMTGERFPPLDLPLIDVRDAAFQIISAILLKPAARIRTDDPAVLPPHGKRLPAFHAEIIEGRIGDIG